MRMARAAAGLFLVALLAVPARADPGYASDPRFAELRRTEAKELGALLAKARKQDYLAQAWWLVNRLLTIDPQHEAALELAESITPDQIEQGAAPDDKFAKQRDKTFQELGDLYFHFGEQCEASGMDPQAYYPLNIQALSYGSRAGPLVTSLEGAGFIWLQTFGDVERARMETLLDSVSLRATWPAPWDDGYMRVKARWPEARVADLGDVRLLTDLPPEPALRLLRIVGEVDAVIGAWEGGRAAAKRARAGATAGDPHQLLVFADGDRYEKLGPELVDERDREDLLARSVFRARSRNRTLVSFAHRQHPFVSGEAAVAGAAAGLLARMRYGAGQGGWVRGRGAWLLDGIAGAFEGFALDDEGRATIDPGRCWSLAVAKELRDSGRLLPWDELLELDEAKAKDVALVDVETEIAGTKRVVSKVDVVRVQATALVVALVKTDGERGARRFAKLVADLVKRDSLPDIDKAMGWKKGRAVEEALRAMDASNAK
ncbi:MAG: hypothetical protein AB7T63_13670 [Planctomycetota bacterium]